jgi:hypothetical protein
MTKMKAKLKQLRADTEAILAEITPEMFPNEAINWGDLRCAEACYVIAETHSEDHYAVEIEEASPDAQHIRAYVREKLADLGWDVYVVTAW